jgi:hypothetical protein
LECAAFHFGICFQKAAAVPASPIFNFSVFVTALTLMVVVFSITDTKFKFRIAVTPTPFVSLSVFVIFLDASMLFGELAGKRPKDGRGYGLDYCWEESARKRFLPDCRWQFRAMHLRSFP